MKNLNITTAIGAYTTSSTQMGNGFAMPSPSMMVVKPLSYEFRVAEHVDENGNISKVGLQVKTWEHDNYGAPLMVQDWTDVERVKIPDANLMHSMFAKMPNA